MVSIHSAPRRRHNLKVIRSLACGAASGVVTKQRSCVVMTVSTVEYTLKLVTRCLWDWPLTNHRPSVLHRCWLGRDSYNHPQNDLCNVQGDHLSGTAGNVREFDSCQGNIGDFTTSKEVSGKNLVRERWSKAVYCKLHI